MIIGNVSNTPELRTTPAGKTVCNFNVAVNRRKKVEGQPDADFFRVSAWDQLGENCQKYLVKGKKVCIIGRVSVRTWETETKHGASLEVLAEEVEFLSPRVSDTANEASPPVDAQTKMPIVETDELPFG